MWPARRPTQVAGDVYRTCITTTKPPWKAWYEGLASSIVDAAARYSDAAQNATLNTLNPHDFTRPIAADDAQSIDRLVKVYTDKLVGQRAPGRQIYDQLRLATRRCPLCGHRDVTTLDHHLPKTKFPLLCVTPDNLVPACAECNKIKLDDWTAIAERQTFHPYFDNIDGFLWLAAEVIEGTPPAVRFFVEPPAIWSRLTTARARHHFEVFDLARLYAVQASDEMAAIAYYLTMQYEAAGEAAVRTHLEDMATSRAHDRPNSWGAAAYSALAANRWYCAGGFRLS
jgi:hypothetical protein